MPNRAEETYAPEEPLPVSTAIGPDGQESPPHSGPGNDFAKAAGEDFRAKYLGGLRDTLARAIARHGGPAAVVLAMGIQPGTKEFRSTLRTVERHSTQAAQQRGATRLSPKYQELYARVFGGEQLDAILSGRGRVGGLPDEGTLIITVKGTIKVSDDTRDREVWAMSGPEYFEAMLTDPLDALSALAGYGPVVLELEWIGFEYESDEDATDGGEGEDYE